MKRKEQDLLKSKDFRITSVPSLMEMSNYCSNSGYGIHSNEILLYEMIVSYLLKIFHCINIQRLWSAMKRLNQRINCMEMKFWGKVFGLFCDYYIVQVDKFFNENKRIF